MVYELVTWNLAPIRDRKSGCVLGHVVLLRSNSKEKVVGEITHRKGVPDIIGTPDLPYAIKHPPDGAIVNRGGAPECVTINPITVGRQSPIVDEGIEGGEAEHGGLVKHISAHPAAARG